MRIPPLNTTSAIERLHKHAVLLGRRAVAMATARSTASSKATAATAVAITGIAAGVAMGIMVAGFADNATAAVSSNSGRAARAYAVVEASAREFAVRGVGRTALAVTAARAAIALAPRQAVLGTTYAAPRTKQEAPAWVNPMPGAPLSSCYGPRWGTMHQGIDLAGKPGTKILSVGAGTVFATGWTYSGYGISVVVDHHNGYLSHYAHASKALVSPGQAVKPGTPLALEGSTGNVTGPHLHFEIHHGMWNQIDPAAWLRARGVEIGC
jgi:murein DD-endopeptidase MepM/ murein hydrolase activator NlpD